MFILVSAHLACPRQSPESRKMVVVVVVVVTGSVMFLVLLKCYVSWPLGKKNDKG